MYSFACQFSYIAVYFVIDRGGAYHQTFYWWVNLYHLMINTTWKVTKLTLSNSEAFTFYINYNTSLKYNKAFIALLMSMKQ